MHILLCIFFFIVAGVLIHSRIAWATDDRWDYVGDKGPEFWHLADPSFAVCKEGKIQSPINVAAKYDANLPPLDLHYKQKGFEIVNNGHTLQVEFSAGNTLVTDATEFVLQQVHFHAPGENRINGLSYPFEAHFVHQDLQGNVAVLAAFFAEGKEHPGIAALWEHLPEKSDETKKIPEGFSARSILPENRDYVYFIGSLTTPPCSEGVRWYVFKNIQTISKEQVQKFLNIMHHPNNRPLQPLNARIVID